MYETFIIFLHIFWWALCSVVQYMDKKVTNLNAGRITKSISDHNVREILNILSYTLSTDHKCNHYF